MKNKKTIILVSCISAILVVSVAVMAFIGNNGAGDSVSAAREYLEASMRYDTKRMANTASDKVRQQLYNTGEIPTVRELIKALNKSYAGVPSGYEGRKISFTVVDEYVSGDTGYVKLNVYVDGVKMYTRECATVRIGGRWYYDGEPEVK